MKDDFISRQAAINAKIVCIIDGQAIDCVPVSKLRNIPAEDVRENVRGEWKWSHGGECSNCGFYNSNFDYNFCPNCGADMRERRTDESN